MGHGGSNGRVLENNDTALKMRNLEVGQKMGVCGSVGPCNTNKESMFKHSSTFLSKFGKNWGKEGDGCKRNSKSESGRVSSLNWNIIREPSASHSDAHKVLGGSDSTICPESVGSDSGSSHMGEKGAVELSSDEVMVRNNVLEDEGSPLRALFGQGGGKQGEMDVEIAAVEEEEDEVRDTKGDQEGYCEVRECDTQVSYYTRRKRKIREKGRSEGGPKFLLSKMDISLVPLKRNLARTKNGKSRGHSPVKGIHVGAKVEEERGSEGDILGQQ